MGVISDEMYSDLVFFFYNVFNFDFLRDGLLQKVGCVLGVVVLDIVDSLWLYIKFLCREFWR